MELYIKHKDRLLQFGINLLFLFSFWGSMLRKSFVSDTIFHMIVEDADILTNIEDGRYAIALADSLLLKFVLRTTTNLSITMLLTFILLAMTMLKIQDIFLQWKPEKLWNQFGFFCGLNMVFCNVLFSEALMFGEVSVYFAIAYLAAAAGVRCFARKRYVSMLVLYGTAVCIYQNAAVFAAILTAFYICLDEQMIFSVRAVFRESIGIAICMGMGG